MSFSSSFRIRPKAFAPVLALAFAACVPTGSAPPYDAGPQPATTAAFKPSINIMTTPFEDNFDRPDAAAGAGGDLALALPGDASSTSMTIDAAVALADGGKLIAQNQSDGGSDVFQLGTAATEDAGPHEKPSNLGPNWSQIRTNVWHIENGRLCGEGAHNHGVWLNKVLPINARIEFDAMALTEDGDLKTEVWGDGHSYATGTSYTNATSYLAILGGWKNTLHVLARINEHGSDRREIKIDPNSDDPRQRSAVRGQLYQFKVERTDGKTVHWSVNGIEYLSWNDATPLSGQGHDHFGFNEWEAKVCFDNVKVTPL